MRLSLLLLCLLAACSGPASPPPGTPPTSSGRGSASMPQPANSLPPGGRVNAGIDNASGPGTVTTRVDSATITTRPGL